MKTIMFCLLALFLPFLVTDNSFAVLYQWQDGAGGVHFTDNLESIPPAYRNKAKARDATADEAAPVSDATPSVDTQQVAPAPTLQKDASVPEKGRGYWQVRYSTLRTEMKSLRDGLGPKKEEMKSYRHKWLVTQKRVERQNLNQIEAEIAKDEQRIKELEKLLEELDVEAARNAVPLDWRK